jgi:membrane peptidoglycan carboxypeptidase
MDIVSQIIIAALFSLHQYIPEDSVETKYFDYAVDPVTLQGPNNGLMILAAAHSSCRHFFKVGGKELDFSEEQLTNFALSIFEQQEENLKELGTTAKKTSKTLERICLGTFNPQAFSSAETKSVQDFIKKDVHILTEQDLNSTGDYKYFGRIELYDRKGKSFGPLLSSSDRWVHYSEISSFLPQALIAAEDENFFRHEGVYLGSLVRMAYNMKTSAADQKTNNITGGSTITMQLLKNMYFNSWPVEEKSYFQTKPKLRTILRKVREWYWAKPFEKFHERLGPGSGKIYVLENYLNLMDYGPNIRGVDQAAHVLLKKQPSEITLSDASFLASLFKGPGIYSRPRNYEKYTVGRRKYVLNKMLKLSVQENGLPPIEQTEYSSALDEPLPQWESQLDSDLESTESSYLQTYARQFLNSEVSIPKGYKALEAELSTTLDADLQKIVFDTVREHLDSSDKKKDSIRRVSAARDDRSRIAIPSTDDVHSEQNTKLRELQVRLDDMQIYNHIAVFLGDSGDRSGAQKSFYHFQNRNGVDMPAEIIKELETAFAAQAQFVGQVFIAETHPSRCAALAPLSSAKEYTKLETFLSKTSFANENPEVAEEVVSDESSGTNEQPEATVVPFQLAEEGELKNSGEIPLPEKRPDDADAIIAAHKNAREANRFSLLEIDSRKAVIIPELPVSNSCVRLLSANELKKMSLWNLFSKTEDDVSKKIVRNFFLRLDAISPRENMLPAIYDGRGESSKPLVVVPTQVPQDPESEYSQWVRPVKLASNAQVVNNKIKSGEVRIGQVFWVSIENESIFKLETPKLQAAVVAMNSETGEVLANFGGYHPKTSRYFDRSRLAERQPGSTLKPWLYYLALNKGFEPYMSIQNDGVEFKVDKNTIYRPDNYSSGSGSATVGFEAAFINSMNKPAIGLLTNPLFGPEPMENLTEFIDLLTSIGIYDKKSVELVPSTALGAQPLKIQDLVSSFAFFANGQTINAPRFFSNVKNGQGETLYKGSSESRSVPYSDNRIALFQMQNLLIKVANEGTARKLRDFPTGQLKLDHCSGRNIGISGQICFGGKTGTSNDNKDNWFVGFSKNFVIGVWVGYDFPESTQATGGELALPIFKDIVERGQKYLPPIEPILTAVPQGIQTVHMDIARNCRAKPGRGVDVFLKTSGLNIPECTYIDCRCDRTLYSGNDYDYTLIVNRQIIQQFTTSDDGRQDQNSCLAAARRMDCPL